MQYHARSSTRAVLLATTLTFAGSWAANAALPKDVLYVQSNDPAAGKNAVLGYHRNADGSLTLLPGSPFLTGGTGFAVPLSAPPGPFDGQNVMAADPREGVIFVPNGGSDSISALRVAPRGALSPSRGSPFAIAGNTPEALGLRDRTLVIVNNASDPNQAGSGVGPSYAVAYLDGEDGVHQIRSATVPLAAGSVPTEALPRNFTSLLYTNEFGAGTLSSYFLDFLGRPHLLQTQALPQQAGVQPVPLGQDLNPVAPYLYVGLPGQAQIATYRVADFRETFVGVVATTNGTAASPSGTGNAPCWVHVSRDGRYAYSSNTASHSISVFDLRNPAAPAVVQTVVLNGVNGATFDFQLSPDGRFMYVVEGATTTSVGGSGNQIHILDVSRGTGRVAEIAASPVNLGVAGHRVEGLLVF